MAIPSGLIESLKTHIPGFDRERMQHGVAAMLWETLRPRRRHKKYSRAYTFSRDDLRMLFGSDTKFREVNRHPLARYFHVRGARNGSSSKSRNFTNGYTPTIPMQEALADFLLSTDASKLLNERGQAIRSIPAAISSLDSAGHQVIGWDRDEAPSKVRIDLDAVKRLSRWYLCILAGDLLGQLPAAFPYEGRDNIGRRARQVLAIVRAASSHQTYGSVLHRYVQAESGRLYAAGANLQNFSRTIRNTALAGMYDYDITCCHFAITHQLAERYGRDCPALRYYVQNKREIRQRIAQEVGISIKQAKAVLTMTAYGAEESVWGESAIPKELGSKNAARRLYANETYRLIKDELAAASAVIIANAVKVRGRFHNMFGKLLRKDRQSDATIMAHLLQGVEAVALRAAIRTCRESVVLLVHDGFVAYRPVDLDAIHAAVKEATGFHLTFECERIISPLEELEKQPGFAHIKVIDPDEPSVHAGLRRILGGGLVTVVDELGRNEQVMQLPPVYPDPIPERLYHSAF